MYTASSSVSAPPRPQHRIVQAGAGPYLAPAPQAVRPRRWAAGTGTQPISGRIDLSGPQGAQVKMAIASVHRICPEFNPVQVLRRSGRSVLIVGTTGRTTAVAKCLLDHSPAWVERFRHEIASYRSFVRRRHPGRSRGRARTLTRVLRRFLADSSPNDGRGLVDEALRRAAARVSGRRDLLRGR